MTRRLPLLLLAVALLLGACTDEASPDDPNQRLVGIYSAAIPAVVTYERPDLRDESLDLVVFVATREDVAIPIEVQIGVVNELEHWATIRFIDEFDEALTGDDDDRTVRDGAVLVQLGSVSDGTTAVTVDADRYEGIGRLLTFDLPMLRRAGEWHVDGDVTATEVDIGA